MPEYCYECLTCGHKHATYLPMSRYQERPLCGCGAIMQRDFAAERVGVSVDKDTSSDDIEQNLAQRHDGRTLRGRAVEHPVLSLSMAHVAGVPKVRAKDGKTYGVFRNRKHRQAVMQKLQIHEE